ncbi:Anticodon-binding domain, partial [Trinorchestia longiramus]
MVQSLSCLALQLDMYIVVDLAEIDLPVKFSKKYFDDSNSEVSEAAFPSPCDERDKIASPDGLCSDFQIENFGSSESILQEADAEEDFIAYNSQVVFDRTGAVVARYRKKHLFFEPEFEYGNEEDSTALFTTDFGVTFTLQVTCCSRSSIFNVPASCLPSPKPASPPAKVEDQQLRYFLQKDKITSFDAFKPERNLQKQYKNLIISRSKERLVCLFMTDNLNEVQIRPTVSSSGGLLSGMAENNRDCKATSILITRRQGTVRVKERQYSDDDYYTRLICCQPLKFAVNPSNLLSTPQRKTSRRMQSFRPLSRRPSWLTNRCSLVCFDIMYSSPAVSNVVRAGVRDVAMSTAWIDELPFLTAPQIFRGFSRGLSSNLIVSNLFNPNAGYMGSGIFHGDHNTSDVYTYDSNMSKPVLIVDDLTTEVDDDSWMNFKEKQELLAAKLVNRIVESFTEPESVIEEYVKLQSKQDKLQNNLIADVTSFFQDAHFHRNEAYTRKIVGAMLSSMRQVSEWERFINKQMCSEMCKKVKFLLEKGKSSGADNVTHPPMLYEKLSELKHVEQTKTSHTNYQSFDSKNIKFTDNSTYDNNLTSSYDENENQQFIIHENISFYAHKSLLFAQNASVVCCHASFCCQVSYTFLDDITNTTVSNAGYMLLAYNGTVGKGDGTYWMWTQFDSIGGLLTMTDHDIFTIGSTVSVTTAVDEDISGEVMAFDSKARVLVLKLPAANNKATMCNIHTVYMSKIKNIHIAEEPESNVSPPPLPEIDISVLRKRFDKAVQERKVISSAMNSKASRIGQQLYIRLAKCMPEARWNDDAAIIVMESVAVTPPYTADFVRPLDSSDGIHHVSNDPLTPGTVEYVKRL